MNKGTPQATPKAVILKESRSDIVVIVSDKHHPSNNTELKPKAPCFTVSEEIDFTQDKSIEIPHTS